LPVIATGVSTMRRRKLTESGTSDTVRLPLAETLPSPTQRFGLNRT
jgi:hypothetical protein